MNNDYSLDVIHSFNPIFLKDMDKVSLMKRVDTKFLLARKSLSELLQTINQDYFILEIDGKRLMSYSSIYFDTDDKHFYHTHHDNKKGRTKVRIRQYVDSDIQFLEVKQKDKKGITNKKRIPLDTFSSDLNGHHSFVNDVTGQSYQLESSITNNFQRITLVNKNLQERVTIDLHLSYEHDEQSRKVDDLVIIEVKQPKFDRSSTIVQELKSYRSHPYSFSKYCIGIASLNPDIKHNRFKEKILKVNKLTTN